MAGVQHVGCRLVARLPEASRKAEEYAALGMFQEAAETAATVSLHTNSLPLLYFSAPPCQCKCYHSNCAQPCMYNGAGHKSCAIWHEQSCVLVVLDLRSVVTGLTAMLQAARLGCLVYTICGCLVQVKDSAMLSKIQGMVGTASPLGATVAQIRDRLTAVTR